MRGMLSSASDRSSRRQSDLRKLSIRTSLSRANVSRQGTAIGSRSDHVGYLRTHSERWFASWDKVQTRRIRCRTKTKRETDAMSVSSPTIQGHIRRVPPRRTQVCCYFLRYQRLNLKQDIDCTRNVLRLSRLHEIYQISPDTFLFWQDRFNRHR